MIVENGFKTAYDSVKRFVGSLGSEPAAPFRPLAASGGRAT